MQQEFYDSNYAVAVNWLRPGLVLVNHIVEVDPNFDYRGHDEPWYEEEDEDMENPIYDQVYMFYLTSLSKADVEWLEKNFDIRFGYSPLLEVYVLLVTHYGTSWDYVYCQTRCAQAAAKLGERLNDR